MRKLIVMLAVLVLLSLHYSVFAAPYYDAEFQLKQPDGSYVFVKVWGDEYFQHVESTDGYTLVRDKRDKWICYAELSSDKTQLISTGEIYHNTQRDLQNRKLKKHIKLPKEIREQEVIKTRQLLDAPSYTAYSLESPPLSPANLLVNTQIIGLTLLIDFPDEAATISIGEIQNYLNQERYSGYGNNGSVNDYFFDISNGNLDYTNYVTNYYTALHNKDYYTDENINYGVRARELINEALNDLEDSGFDFSTLSVDSGNYIIAINAFYAGWPSGGWAEGLWPHKANMYNYFSADGVISGGYQITNIGSSLVLGTFCHENGHLVCGWPDMYDYGHESSGLGNYCLMASGASSTNPCPPNPYLRGLCGWQTVVDIYGMGGQYSVTANDFEMYRYMNQNNNNEFFLIESVLQSDRYSAWPDEGLAIWHIDENGNNNYEQMTENLHYMVSLEQADNDFDLETGNNAGDGSDLFDETNNVFSDNTSPDALWWDSSESGLYIYNISSVSGMMSFVLAGGNYTVTVSAGANGGVSPAGSVSVAGRDDLLVSAMPDPGYVVAQWLVDGVVAQIGLNVFTLEDVQADHLLEVAFMPALSVIYVDDDNNTGPWNGTQANPYQRIQDGVNVSSIGTEIIVAQGIYYENVLVQNFDITLSSSAPEDPVVVANTVIDGSGMDSVMKIIDSNFVINGFTVTNGNGDEGGGLGVGSSSIEIYNCIISQNTTKDLDEWKGMAGGGGGLYLANSTAMIFNSEISNNVTGGDSGVNSVYSGSGGGIYSEFTGLSIFDCKINNNSTGHGGSGYPGVDAGNGGGIWSMGGSLLISSTEILNNSTGHGGGGIDMLEDGGDGGDGGGIYSSANFAMTMTNCIVSGNSTGNGGWGGELPDSYGGNGGDGAGVHCMSGDINNCTFFDNSTGTYGCSYYCGSPGSGGGVFGPANIENSIIWGNSFDQLSGYDCSNISYCDIASSVCEGSNGNISVDPLFADSGNGDCHLKSQFGRRDPSGQQWVYDAVTSPCIDGGDLNSVWVDELWPHGKRINMGGYGGTAEASMSASTAGNIADFNNDGKVNLYDFALFSTKWPVSQILLREDLNRNNVVNIEDMIVFAENWLFSDFDLDEGLVGHWKLDDGQGIVASDSSDFDNTGTLINSPVWTTGLYDGALNFNDNDDAVEIPFAMMDPDQGTISLWAYSDGFFGESQYLFGHTLTTNPWSDRIQLYVEDQNGGLNIGIGDSHYVEIDCAILNTQQWYHVTLTWDHGVYVVYVDAENVAEGFYSGLSEFTSFADVGNDGSTLYGSEGWLGLIDEVRAYNIELSPETVSALYLDGVDDLVEVGLEFSR